MKEENLYELKKVLFEQDLVRKFDPKNLKKEGESVFIFSDYYGALLGIERFLKNKEGYQSFDSGHFKKIIVW